MKLLVGLGNPGAKYLMTRHNVGFIILDLLAQQLSESWSSEKFKGVWLKGTLFGEPVMLLKPQTFMNLSGQCVVPFAHYYKIAVRDVIVVHDEADIAFGEVKAKVAGGHGGNNGVRSIIEEFGSNEFHRIKVGVGRPAVGDLSNWVLSSFSQEELEKIGQDVVEKVLIRLRAIFSQSKSV